MIRISDVWGDRHGSVDEDDRERATQAAEAVCIKAAVPSDVAAKAYREQWLQFQDEDKMTGNARVWIDAEAAASAALTSTWAVAGNVFCTLGAEP